MCLLGLLRSSAEALACTRSSAEVVRAYRPGTGHAPHPRRPLLNLGCRRRHLRPEAPERPAHRGVPGEYSTHACLWPSHAEQFLPLPRVIMCTGRQELLCT